MSDVFDTFCHVLDTSPDMSYRFSSCFRATYISDAWKYTFACSIVVTRDLLAELEKLVYSLLSVLMSGERVR